MRVFVGINLSQDIKKKIVDLQKEISEIFSKISIPKIENIHLTLKFLGEISEEQCKEFGQNLETILSDKKSFSLQIQNFGVFPNIFHPKILWIGVEKNNYLLEIQKDIESLASKFDVAPEKNFKEHITIARNKNKINIESFKQLYEKFKDVVWGNIMVNKIYIIESKLKPAGAEYNILKTITLGEKTYG